MSKLTLARLFLTVFLVALHGSLLICETEGCWNESFALPVDHPAHRLLSWTIKQLPFHLSVVQSLAQSVMVAEGVIILNLLVQSLCSCILFVIQGVMIMLAIGLCYQISQQDLHTTFMAVKASIQDYLYWTAVPRVPLTL
jgi:CBS domain containing-hemolysin-like protein